MRRFTPVYAAGLAALAILAATGCQTETPASAASRGSGKPGAAEPRQVHVAAALEEPVTRAVEATGTLAAQDQIALSMKVAGRIETLTVDLGDRVGKGQVIATLDPTDFRIQVEQAAAALQQARTRLGLMPDGSNETVRPEQTGIVKQALATLNEARLNRDRAKQLYDQKLIARADYDTVVAAWQVAEGRYQDAVEEVRNRQAVLAQRKSELELARQQLANAVLRSPIDGAVSARQVSIGEYVNTGAPVVTIVRLHPLRLRLPVPERPAAAVRVGQEVRVQVDQDLNTYYGRVVRLSPSIDAANRTLLVEAEVPNERGTLRPGAFVRAQLVTRGKEPAVFVPASAIVTFAGIEKVLIVHDGKAVEKTVRTGRKDERKVEIAEGLQPGEQVIVQPGNLVGGQPVVIVNR